MSASGAGCCHIDHVITQAPYAVCTAIISGVSFIALGWTHSVGLSFAIGFVCLLLLSTILKKRSRHQKAMQPLDPYNSQSQ